MAPGRIRKRHGPRAGISRPAPMRKRDDHLREPAKGVSQWVDSDGNLSMEDMPVMVRCPASGIERGADCRALFTVRWKSRKDARRCTCILRGLGIEWQTVQLHGMSADGSQGTLTLDCAGTAGALDDFATRTWVVREAQCMSARVPCSSTGNGAEKRFPPVKVDGFKGPAYPQTGGEPVSAGK